MRVCSCIVLFCMIAAVHSSTPLVVNTTNRTAPHPTSPWHPGVTLDWWVHNDTTYGYQWGNTSILTIDLQDPKLIALAKGLNGSLLRIGGSPVDSILFDVDGTCHVQQHEEVGGYHCSQVGLTVYGCLTKQRVTEIFQFAVTTGLHIVLGFSACTGRLSGTSSMNFSNAVQLFEFVASLPINLTTALVGFEFGNEVLQWPHDDTYGVSPATYGADINSVRKLIRTAFQNSSSRPLLVAPAQGFNSESWSGMLQAIIQGNLDVATYHQYPCCSPPPLYNKSERIGSPSCFETIGKGGSDVFALTSMHNVAAWMGEGAAHYAGGMDKELWLGQLPSSYYFSYNLGALPLTGVTLSARQTLAGGNYGLLNRSSFDPQPDYWVALITRQLHNGRSLRALHMTQEPLFADGAVAVFGFVDDLDENYSMYSIVNLSPSPFTLSLHGPHTQVTKSAVQYRLAPLTGENWFTFNVSLNGHELRMVDGDVPNIKSWGVPCAASVNVLPFDLLWIEIE